MKKGHKEILDIAIPSIVSNITVPLLGLIDVTIVGHLGSASYIGAIAVGGMLFNIIYWIFGFLRMGTSGMTSQAFGANNPQETHALLIRSLSIGGCIASLLILLQYPIEQIALLFINPSEETAKRGYAFYGAEKCSGYENLLSFVKKYPENKEEHFYIVSYGATWGAGKISYSETEESWIFTEYWIDTFRENERHEKDFDISEIIIYENRVSVYLENGNKKVFYEKGSELGLPINNCSHPLQAHYIEIEIIKYINSEEFKTKYEETHSEPYLDFDEFTKTLYDEEEKCLINIYHYIEYYGLTYDDFIAAYGSEENIAEIWAEADIKGYFGK